MSALIVGLTGGIGSGKTTVANLFNELGIDIVDADIVARQVVAPNSPALQSIVDRFGPDYLDSSGHLNRALLRTRIFSHDEDKHWLNNLLHPLIRQTLLDELKQARSPYCLLVAPLLIENNLHTLVDRVLVIDVDESVQLARTLKRDTSNESEIKAIIASQISRDKRLLAADDVINNNHSDLNNKLTNTRQQVLKLDSFYRQCVLDKT